MRTLFGSFAALLVMLVIGCSTVDPDQCWPNTSGGFGGSGTIPIGAGVGATSGDFLSPPPGGYPDNNDTPNPCVEGDPASGGDPSMGGGTLSIFKPSTFPF